MTDKSEWQEANRELLAEQRRRLGDPPTAEEMLAFTRGELSESEEERIRDLIVAYPELARMYCEPIPEEPRPGDADYVPEHQVAASLGALQQRLRKRPDSAGSSRDEAQRGRVLFIHYFPTAVAAVLAIVFFGLYVQAEGRARNYATQSRTPHMLGAPQELTSDGNRGPGGATLLSKDGDVYWLRPVLGDGVVRYPHYQIELYDAKGPMWSNRDARIDGDDDAFQIIVPHAFLREGESYQLRIFGVDGETRQQVGTYDLSVPAE